MLDASIMGWWWQGMCKEGTPESEVHADIAPKQGEKEILKHRYSAFYNTDLETILRCLHPYVAKQTLTVIDNYYCAPLMLYDSMTSMSSVLSWCLARITKTSKTYAVLNGFV